MARTKASKRAWVPLRDAALSAGISESTLRRWVSNEKVESRLEANGPIERRVVILDQVLDLTSPAGSKTNGGPRKRANGSEPAAKTRVTNGGPRKRANGSEPAAKRRVSNQSPAPRATPRDPFNLAIEQLTFEAERAGRFESEISALRKKVSEVQSEAKAKAKIEGQLVESRALVADLKAEVATLAEQLERATVEAADRALLEWSHSEVVTRAEQAEQRSDDLLLELRDARAGAVLRDRAEALAQQRFDENEVLQGKLVDLEGQRAAGDSRTAELIDLTKTLRARIEDLEKRLAQEVKEAAQAADVTRDMISSLQRESAASTEEIQRARSSLEETTRAEAEGLERIAWLERELDTARSENLTFEDLRNEIVELRGYEDEKQRRALRRRKFVAWVGAALALTGSIVHQFGSVSYEMYDGSTAISATSEGANAEIEHGDGRTESFSGTTAAAQQWLDQRTEVMRAEDGDAEIAQTSKTIGVWVAAAGGALLALVAAAWILKRIRRSARSWDRSRNTGVRTA